MNLSTFNLTSERFPALSLLPLSAVERLLQGLGWDENSFNVFKLQDSLNTVVLLVDPPTDLNFGEVADFLQTAESAAKNLKLSQVLELVG